MEDVLWAPEERTEANLWMGFIRPMHNKYQTGGLQHLLATQIRHEIGSEIFDAYFKFTFIRNPWEKAASQYAYTMQSRPDLQAFLSLGDETSFEHYLERTRVVRHVQWMPQHEFIYDRGRLLVDYVGRVESFTKDFTFVLQRLGMSADSIPHRNSSNRMLVKRYSRAAVELIADIYATDIEMFGYQCPWPVSER